MGKIEKNGKFQKKSENFGKNQKKIRKKSENFRLNMKKDDFYRKQLVDVFLTFQISTSTDP